jgi:hypothetical protein
MNRSLYRGLALALAGMAAGVALAAPADPQTEPKADPKTQIFRRQMAATVEETPLPEGAWARKMVLPRYEFFTLYPERGESGEPEQILLEQVFRVSEQTNAEGSQSTLEAIAWKSGKRRYDTKLWSFTDDANESEMFRWGEFFSTTQYGCCASENVQRIYDLRTGKLAAVSTTKPAVVEVPNTPVRRIVAYHCAVGVVQPPEFEKIPRLLGVLTLSARTEVLHRVAVVDAAAETDRPEFSPELIVRVDGKDGDVGTDVSLWSAEKNPVPANISGFRAEMGFFRATDDKRDLVIVPIVKDDFDLEHATVPATLKLVRVK